MASKSIWRPIFTCNYLPPQIHNNFIEFRQRRKRANCTREVANAISANARQTHPRSRDFVPATPLPEGFSGALKKLSGALWA
eukprot:3786873-Karenia_brevis.AAC.1